MKQNFRTTSKNVRFQKRSYYTLLQLTTNFYLQEKPKIAISNILVRGVRFARRSLRQEKFSCKQILFCASRSCAGRFCAGRFCAGRSYFVQADSVQADFVQADPILCKQILCKQILCKQILCKQILCRQILFCASRFCAGGFCAATSKCQLSW